MTTPAYAPDLTQRPPRSPRLRLGGYVFLPRLIDKGRASLAGKLGEYRYTGKGMDRHFYNFTGISQEAFTAALTKTEGDDEVLAWVGANLKQPRMPWEIEAWSSYFERRGPDSDAETLADFAESVGVFTKTREDVRTWFDLLDLDDHCSFGGKA